MEPFCKTGGGVRVGGQAGRKLKGDSPYAANQALPLTTPKLDTSPTFTYVFVNFYLLMVNSD